MLPRIILCYHLRLCLSFSPLETCSNMFSPHHRIACSRTWVSSSYLHANACLSHHIPILNRFAAFTFLVKQCISDVSKHIFFHYRLQRQRPLCRPRQHLSNPQQREASSHMIENKIYASLLFLANSSTLGIIIGCSVGGGVLLVGIGIAVYICVKKSKAKQSRRRKATNNTFAMRETRK